MVKRNVGITMLAAFGMGGCGAGSLESERTVFNNPYAPPVVDRTGIGPQCDVARGRDATCLGVPLTRNGRGSAIGTVRAEGLTRNQRRILREQAELLRTPRQQPVDEPSPPVPTAPPIAAQGTDAEEP